MDACAAPSEGVTSGREAASTDHRWLDVKLAEYEALRAEVTTSITTQQSILSFGAATIALIFAPGLDLWGKPSLSVVVILNALIPILSGVVLLIWWGEVLRMVRAGDRLADIEKQVYTFGKTHLGWMEAPLGWETSLRSTQTYCHWFRRKSEVPLVRQFVINVRGVVLAFLLIALASGLLGVLSDREEGGVSDSIIGSACSAVVLLLIAAYMARRWNQEYGQSKKLSQAWSVGEQRLKEEAAGRAAERPTKNPA